MKKRLEKLVAFERICRVATVGSSGVPHLVPVCHVLDDGKLYFASEGKARKVQNLRARPHAAITVDFYAEDWSSLRGVMIQGRTKILDGGSRFKKLRKRLYEKYPQYPDQAPLGDGDVIVEVTPQHVFSWGVD